MNQQVNMIIKQMNSRKIYYSSLEKAGCEVKHITIKYQLIKFKNDFSI